MSDKTYTCPICQSESFEYIYKDKNDEVVGCSDCCTLVEFADYCIEVDEAEQDAADNAAYDDYMARRE